MSSTATTLPGRTGLDSLHFGASFAELPAAFYTHVAPAPLPNPYLIAVSRSAAALVGLDPEELRSPEGVELFTGNRVHPTSRPLAAVYSGHQFGVWAGQLGDGRALLLGDLQAKTPEPPGVMELQLKGAGRTPYSRMGDGRAVLRSSIREFLCSEAMAGLGIPTTRALCLTGSDHPVFREQVETAAVVTRMAPAFIRFGSFEHWLSRSHPDSGWVELRALADHVIRRFYPHLSEAEKPPLALLGEVVRRTARLMARWQGVGFMHGVMNTDNMSILGQTLDYGPYGFMDAFDPSHICNHSDHTGRYAYAAQPQIGNWNCWALGRALLPLIDDVDATRATLETFTDEFNRAWDDELHAKLGLRERRPEDAALFVDLFGAMHSGRADFTLLFRALCDLRLDEPLSDAPARALFVRPEAYDAWAVRYRARLAAEGSVDALRRAAMRGVNPRYVLRNHLAHTAIEKAQARDYSEIERLLDVLEHPYDDQPESARFAEPPPDWACKLSVSCSS